MKSHNTDATPSEKCSKPSNMEKVVCYIIVILLFFTLTKLHSMLSH